MTELHGTTKLFSQDQAKRTRMSNHAKLPARALDVLGFIADYLSKYHFPPSVREMCNGTGISSTSVCNYYLYRLAAFGLIERREHKISRGIVITAQGYEELGIKTRVISIVCPHCNTPFDTQDEGVFLMKGDGGPKITKVNKYKPKQTPAPIAG